MEAASLEQLKIAVDLVDRGHSAEGARLLEALRLEYPEHPVILGTLGMMALAECDYGTAEQLLDAAVRVEPTFYPALVNKGILLAHLGDIEGALPLYDQALQLNPAYLPAYSNKGIALSILGRYEEALALYDRALALDSRFVDGRHNRAYTLHQIGRTEEAIDELRVAIALNPAHGAALRLKLSIHQSRGEENEVAHCLELLKAIE